MYDVLEVCRHIIKYCNLHGYGVSNLKLQKLLYFIQAYFLIASPDKQPCFHEAIEAWDFGPVVPEAYHEFKQFGSAYIPFKDFFLDYSSENIFDVKRVPFIDNIISEVDKTLIDAVIEKFKYYTATDLVRITHNQRPWQEAHARKYNREITKNSLKEYFNGK